MQTINLNLHLENLLPDHFEYSFYSYYSTRTAEGKLKTPKNRILYESAAKMKPPGFAQMHEDGRLDLSALPINLTFGSGT